MRIYMVLPMEIVYLIRSYLKWRDQTQLVSRDWLYGALSRRVRLLSWRSSIRIYSYILVFGQAYTRMSWSHFCKQMGITRRVRNTHGRLTWRAAASCYMAKRCKACGQQSRSNVHGICLCTSCRFNPGLKYAYMIMVRDAKRMQVPKRILEQVPFHLCGMRRLRFLYEIESFYD